MANFQVGSPIDYGQPRNLGVDIASGVAGIYQGLQGFQQQQAQQAEQQAMKEFQGAFGRAYASGDRDAMRQLVAKYPGQFEQVQKGLTIMNADNQQRMGEASADLRMAASTGNHEAVAAAASKHQDLLQSLGTSPEDIARSYQQDPQAFAFQADMIGLHSLGPEKYFDVMDKRAQRDIQREGQRVQMRGQDIQMRGQDISAATAAADRAQRAQSQAQNISMKLMELGQKPKLSAGDIKGINSDITTLKKDADVMYGAARDLQTIRENATPAAQLAAIFKYMKALDPTSVVREGEQVMLQRTGGVFDTVGNYINQLNNGSRLNAKQLKDLTNTAKRLSNASAESVNKSLDDYLGTYGDTLSEEQRKLFQNRKLKTFDVGAAEKDEVSKGSQMPPQQSASFTSTGGITFKVKS